MNSKSLLIFLFTFVFMTNSIQAQNLKLEVPRRGLPEIIFAYPTDMPVISEQSQVATIVYNEYYKVNSVDGIRLWGNKAPVRRYRTFNTFKEVIDVLPGKRTISIKYHESIWVDEKKRKYVLFSPKPIDLEMEFEAGSVYQIKAIVVNFNFIGLSLSKEITNQDIIPKIIESRNNYK